MRHAPKLALLLLLLARRARAQTPQQCCSEDAITCAATCTGCLPCIGCAGCMDCLDPVVFALTPSCWACTFCIGCLPTCGGCVTTGCVDYVPCYTSPLNCTDTLTWAGRHRSWSMGPTTCVSPPCALVLVLHGWTMTDDSMRGITEMDAKVGDHGGAVVAYPDGIGVGGWSCWSVGEIQNLGQCAFDHTVDDVGFINALLDRLISRYSIDTDRIYATGFSNGGAMSLFLACHLSHRIAAFGLVSSGPLINVALQLAAPRWSCPSNNGAHRPMMFIHGSDDPGAWFDLAESTARWWANTQGYAANDHQDPCPSGRSCVSTVWTSGGTSPSTAQSTVALIRVNGGGHWWDMSPAWYPTTDRLLGFLFQYRQSALLAASSPPSAPSAFDSLSMSCASHADCTYSECVGTGLSHFCWEGTCYAGGTDSRCNSVANGERYPSMAPDTWCWDGRADFVCPPQPPSRPPRWLAPSDGVPLSGAETDVACNALGGRLCYYAELCPHGPGQKPEEIPDLHSDWLPFRDAMHGGRRWISSNCDVHEQIYCDNEGTECCNHGWCTTSGVDGCDSAKVPANGFSGSCKGSYGCCATTVTASPTTPLACTVTPDQAENERCSCQMVWVDGQPSGATLHCRVE